MAEHLAPDHREPVPSRLAASSLVVVVVAALVLSLSAFVVADGGPAEEADGARAADFSLRDDHDRRVKLSDLAGGRPVLLVFSAGPLAAAEADGVEAALESRPDVQLVAVRPQAAPCAALRDVAGSVDVGRVTVLGDPGGDVAEVYGVDVPAPAAPTAVFVDADGTIRARGPLAEWLAQL